MNALKGVVILAPSVPVEVGIISITSTNQIMEIVHPAAIPTSNLCYSVVKSPAANRILKLL